MDEREKLEWIVVFKRLKKGLPLPRYIAVRAEVVAAFPELDKLLD